MPIPSTHAVSRRAVLQAAGFVGLSGLLAACGGEAASGSAVPSPSPVPSGPQPSAMPSVGTALAVFEWTGETSAESVKEFETLYGVTDIRQASFGSHTELLEALKAGETGYDIVCPSAEHLPELIEGGYLARLDFGRLPNASLVDPAFQHLWWDPDQAWHVPRRFGDTTGILYRGSQVETPPASWKDFDTLVRKGASGKTVLVDSMNDVLAYPLKMQGHSLNSVNKKELSAARKALLAVAPHILAIDSETYGQRLARGEATLALGWTGPLFDELAGPTTTDAAYVVPDEGTLYRLDTWTILADAPHPDAAYAWLDFMQQPSIAARESDASGYATTNTEARALVDPALTDNPAIYPPATVLPRLEPLRDLSSSNQRLDIWEEFKAKVAAG